MLVGNEKKSTKENTNKSFVAPLGARREQGIIAHALQIYLDVLLVIQNIFLMTIRTTIAPTEIRFSHFGYFSISLVP